MSATYRTLTIPANGHLNWQISGRVFRCYTASADYSLSVDNGEPVTVTAGRGFGDTASATFDRLTFTNSTGTAITTYVGIGDGPLNDPQTTVSNTVSVQANLSNELDDCVAATPSQFAKTVSSAGTAVALTTSTFVRKALVFAFKTEARGANTGNVYLGVSATGSNQPIILGPGQEYVIEPSVGNKTNLASWYVNADQNGDGVVVLIVS